MMMLGSNLSFIAGISPTAGVLAAFVSPTLLTAGAAATALPILIHLLARRRFKRIRWAAMEFLLTAQRRNRRRLRFEEWILLALRCLAVLLIGMLVARPFLTPNSLVAALGGATQTERVFVIDDSFSMGYHASDTGESVFDRAKRAVERLIQSVRTESPDDTVTLLKMSSIREPVESGTYLNDAQTDDLLMRLAALSPSQQAIDPSRVIDGIVEVLERNPGLGGVAVYLISDFQLHDWAGKVEGQKLKDQKVVPNLQPSTRTQRQSDILAKLAKWAGDDRPLRLVLVNVADSDPSNTAITDLTLQDPQPTPGDTTRLGVNVANHSSRTVPNLELQWTIAARAQPAKRISKIDPQRTVTVELPIEFQRSGQQEVRIALPADSLPIDNQRYMAVDVADAVRILIVNGEPSPDSYSDELTFLTTALRPEGELFTGNELVIVDEAQFDGALLSGGSSPSAGASAEAGSTPFHLVILANVYRMSDSAAASLERFVRGGGGLIVFLGDQVDADLYNATLYRDGAGILPARLDEVIRATPPVHLVVADRLHPAMRGLSRSGDPLGIGQVGFYQYFACEPYVRSATTADAADAALDADNGDRESDRSADEVVDAPAHIVARFDDAEQHPAIVERSVGRGRVVLVTTSADKEWHLWPDHPTFLPVMLELAKHVARRRDKNDRHLVGAPIEMSLDPSVFESDVVVRLPSYPAEGEASVTAVPADDGQGLRLTWEHTESAGFYRFLFRRRGQAPLGGSGEVEKLLAVNVDPRESDLTSAGESALRQALTSVPFDYVEGLKQLDEGATEARSEMWRPMLLAVVALLMGEQWLAWRWGRR